MEADQSSYASSCNASSCMQILTSKSGCLEKELKTFNCADHGWDNGYWGRYSTHAICLGNPRHFNSPLCMPQAWRPHAGRGWKVRSAFLKSKMPSLARYPKAYWCIILLSDTKWILCSKTNQPHTICPVTRLCLNNWLQFGNISQVLSDLSWNPRCWWVGHVGCPKNAVFRTGRSAGHMIPWRRSLACEPPMLEALWRNGALPTARCHY